VWSGVGCDVSCSTFCSYALVAIVLIYMIELLIVVMLINLLE
jgi:hypothetical protein